MNKNIENFRIYTPSPATADLRPLGGELGRGMNRKWSVLIYIMIVLAVIISLFAYIAVQALGNLAMLNAIKKSLSLDISGRGLYEEMLTGYADDPVYGRKSRGTQGKYSLISRYKDFIQASANISFPYMLSLTDIDGEYGNSLKSLKYIDIFWNESTQNAANPCSLGLSYLKWDKGSTNSLANNKTVLTSTGFPSLTSVSYRTPTTVDIYFSTGVSHSGWALSASEFVYNGPGTLQSVTRISDAYYTGSISASVALDAVDCKSWCSLLGLSPGGVQSGTKVLASDLVPIRRERRSYVNRYRLKDSGAFLDLVGNNVSLSLSSSRMCFFGLEWGDSSYRIVPLPDKKAETNITLFDAANPAITRQFQYSDIVKLWVSLFLSNYLYKIY